MVLDIFLSVDDSKVLPLLVEIRKKTFENGEFPRDNINHSFRLQGNPDKPAYGNVYWIRRNLDDDNQTETYIGTVLDDNGNLREEKFKENRSSGPFRRFNKPESFPGYGY